MSISCVTIIKSFRQMVEAQRAVGWGRFLILLLITWLLHILSFSANGIDWLT